MKWLVSVCPSIKLPILSKGTKHKADFLNLTLLKMFGRIYFQLYIFKRVYKSLSSIDSKRDCNWK